MFIKNYFSRYPLTERVTYWYDAQASIWFGIFNGMAATFLMFVGRKIGLDSDQLSILSVSSFVGLFLNFLVGHWSEKGNKRLWVLWAGISARVLVTISLLWLNPVYYLIVISLFNIIATFGGPAYTSIMRSNYQIRHRGDIMGSIRIIIQIVSAIVAAFAGWIMDIVPFGHQILFPIAGIFGIISSLVFWNIKPRQQAIQAQQKQEELSIFKSLKLIAQDKFFMIYMIAYFIIGFPDKLLVPLEPIRFIDELHMNYAASGLIQGTIPLIGAMIGYFIFVKFSHKISPFILLLATVLLVCFRFINTAIATDPYHLIPGAFLGGISLAGWDLIPLFTIALFVGNDRTSLYFGFFSTLVGIRGILGPIIGNSLYRSGVAIVDVYWLALILELIGAIFLIGFMFYYKARKHTLIPQP